MGSIDHIFKGQSGVLYVSSTESFIVSLTEFLKEAVAKGALDSPEADEAIRLLELLFPREQPENIIMSVTSNW